MRTTSIFLRIAIVATLLGGLAAVPAEAQDVTLIIENDPAQGNSRPDDLYTSSLTVHAGLSRGTLRFGERMFTDRQRGLRFDESWISYSSPSMQLGAWEGEASAGVLRVGRGFIGERAQNVLHDWIGSDRVELPYLEDGSTFPTAELRARRDLGPFAAANWSARTEAFTAPAFRSWVRGSILAERELGGGVTLGAGVGVRKDRAAERYFGQTIRGSGPTAELSVAWRSIGLRWSYNDHGTGTPNVSIGYTTSPAALLRR